MSGYSQGQKPGGGYVLGMVGMVITVGLLVVGVIIGLWATFGAVHRWQTRANAANKIQVYQRQLRVTKIQAQIRYQQGVGIRESQDEIAKTLTPLYVQFELGQSLQAIATSGKNNTVIYLPTSPTSGLPVVPTSNTPAVTK